MRILYLILFFTQFCLASVVIQGRVSDERTGEPLPFTNVYLSGTTFGAAANDSGYYEFAAPSGAAEIVFSRIGYKPYIEKVFLLQDSVFICDAQLQNSPIQTAEIEITAESAATRQRRLKMFNNGFLGTEANARLCAIENPDVLDFDETSTTLTAFAADPLVIQNFALGYRIHIVLDTFLLEKKSNNCFYKVYAFFQDLESEKELGRKVWIQNRNAAYRTSYKYFFVRLLRQPKQELKIVDYEIINFSVKENKLKPLFFVDVQEFRIERLYKNTPIYRLYWFKNNVLRFERFSKRSYIYFLDKYIDFDENGNFIDATQFKLNGEWANQRIADLLPHDFKVQRVMYSKRPFRR